MYEWRRQIQQIVDEIDGCIRSHDDAALTLRSLSRTLGYSEYYTTRKFREISGMQLRDYLRRRRLAFALREVRDSERSLLDIALDYGFSSHEAFTRAFKDAYGVTPSAYRAAPRPVLLRSKIHPFDRYFLGLGEIGMATSKDGVKTYFVTIPAHKFLHIENRESNGYWDFWQKQALIPGQNCETICGLLESIQGKLDDDGGEYAGQVMGYLNDATGRLCDWGYLRTECYGARLPADYRGEVPAQMLLTDIPEGEYLVFEHGPFDYEQECRTVEEKVEAAMRRIRLRRRGLRPRHADARARHLLLLQSRAVFQVHPPVKRLNNGKSSACHRQTGFLFLVRASPFQEAEQDLLFLSGARAHCGDLIAGLRDRLTQRRLVQPAFREDDRLSLAVGGGDLPDRKPGANDVADMRLAHSAHHAADVYRCFSHGNMRSFFDRSGSLRSRSSLTFRTE